MTHTAPSRLPRRSAIHSATTRPPIAFAAPALLGAALLAACGGGGSPDTQAGAQTVSQQVKVVDGPIRNALVCLDQNANGQCDTGEPQGRTGADGTYTFTLAQADAHRHAVLAVVGTDAVDADHGAVTTAYTLQAPADQPAVVSPLTTLVVAQAQLQGLSTTDAAKLVQDGLGLASSPLADFSAAATGSADAAQAAAAARLVVLSVQKQARDTAGAQDASGNALASADMAQAIHRNLLLALPAMADAVSQPAIAEASSAAARADALQAAADAFTTSNGLNAGNIATAVALAKLPSAPEQTTTTPAAGLSLRWFTYTDAQNYNFRYYQSTAAQNTVVDGKRQYTEYRQQSRGSGGNVSFYQQWGEGLNNWARNQVVWTGSAWFTCPTDFVHEATAWDANGRSSSLYCKAFATTNVRKEVDIAGRPMADVVREIRASTFKDGGNVFASWGPDPAVHADKLGGTFPAGAKLYYYTGSDTSVPEAYNTHSSDVQPTLAAGVAAGTPSACSQVNGSNFRQFIEDGPQTLETMIARNRGTPCVYSRDEWWGNSTLGIGDIATNDTDASGYFRNGVKALRFSFTGSGNGVAYWMCLRRAADGSVRNCTAAGSGSYRIETLGDGRVLRLAGVPAVANTLNYTRSMVERQGTIWFGYRSKPTVTQQIRPNLLATQALFTALGIPAPQAGAALTADSLLRDYTPQQGRISGGGTGTFARGALGLMPVDTTRLVGAWSVASDDNTQAQTVFFFADGSLVMADPQGDLNGTASCGGPGYERGSYTWDSASRTLSFGSFSLDSNGCAGVHDTTDNSAGAGTVVMAADGQSMVFTDRDGSTTLYRVRN